MHIFVTQSTPIKKQAGPKEKKKIVHYFVNESQ